ncbi:MAG: class II aldolase/adducin family protein [Alphaproteobacteria bacterium]
MAKVTHLALRRAIVATCRRMNALGINQGTSGNVSSRVSGGLLITPSGVPYEAMTPGGIVAMAADGTVKGDGKPSSEWRFHVDILAARPDAGAIVHTHSVHATALSCLRRDIPAFHYMVAVGGGDTIRCADYATFGTQTLSDHALAALDGRRACLLANHGVIATGRDLDAALALAVEVETLAQQYLLALQVGKPTILGKGEMRRVVEKFANYGQK